MAVPRDIDFAVADLQARLACARAAAEACAGAPEKAVETARELYAFAMDGASDHFKRLVDRGRRIG